MKVYAVKNGRKPGIYRTWDEAKAQIDGFSNAEYKSFTQITDAVEYLNLSDETKAEIMKPSEDNLANAIKRIQTQSKNLSQRPVEKNSVKTNNASSKAKYADYEVLIFTDGGCRNHGNNLGDHVKKDDKAAWAYLIETDNQRYSKAGGEYGATNNKMEQTALIQAMKRALAMKINDKKTLFVLDSQYVLNAITKKWIWAWRARGWKRSGGPLKNKEEWQEISRLLPQFKQADFEWTKGHADNYGNNFVDSALNQYMDEHM